MGGTSTTEPEETEKENGGAGKPLILAPGREPTMKEWQLLLDYAAEAEPEIALPIQLLLLNLESGRAYLEYVTRYRPELREDPLDFIQLYTTYETLELLNRLLMEPRFGTDPDFFLWKDVWNKPNGDMSDEYQDLIVIAQGMEDQAPTEGERLRLKTIREALEREFRGEEYLEHKNKLLRSMK